jgi:ubiquinol-cytochrome c reductase cytochrome b subunit
MLRGIHHFTAQAMIVLLALHLMQVVIDGAYKAPREINFWLGLILLKIVLGLSLTGYLLPWDQKGYWATKVATNIAGITPVVGDQVQKLAVGGLDYGHHTLTRFFALHAGLLPALLVFFLVLHIYVFRRHGITAPDDEWQGQRDTTFWPDQVLKDGVACLAVLATVLFFVVWHGFNSGSGAELGAPADPAESYSAARPEWYFLFLFQFLKYFPGESEVIGAMVIPGAVVGFMFLMPFTGRWKLGHRFNVLFVFALLAGVGVLTCLAAKEDRANPEYVAAVKAADTNAERVKQLVELNGIGPEGAVHLLRRDAKTQGPKLFATHCGVCHRFDGHDGSGKVPTETATASDLGNFGTRDWIRAMITDPAGDKNFGATKHGSWNGEPLEDRFAGGAMAEWATENVKSGQMKKEEIDGVVEFLIGQAVAGGGRRDLDPPLFDAEATGKEFFASGSDNVTTSCYGCHEMKIDDELFKAGSDAIAAAPDLTGYASEKWLKEFIGNPGDKKFYGKRNAMPAFAGTLTDLELQMLVDWILHRWQEPQK